jgi:GAF domain-containing protein
MANLDAPERLSRFRGELVSGSNDEVLDQCVQEASKRLEAPIALVTFVMSQVQYFRAACGLPPEIDLSRATARCHSYCQFVVSSERPLAINDILADPEMPQTLAQMYGIRSYLGVPVTVEDQVLGTLCVVDIKTRKWSAADIEKLTVLAKLVTRRLGELALRSRVSAETPEAIEMRVLASTVAEGARLIERALAEVGPLVRLAGGLGLGSLPLDAFVRGASALKEATNLYFELVDAARQVSNTGERLAAALQPSPATRSSH